MKQKKKRQFRLNAPKEENKRKVEILCSVTGHERANKEGKKYPCGFDFVERKYLTHTQNVCACTVLCWAVDFSDNFFLSLLVSLSLFLLLLLLLLLLLSLFAPFIIISLFHTYIYLHNNKNMCIHLPKIFFTNIYITEWGGKHTHTHWMRTNLALAQKRKIHTQKNEKHEIEES